MPAASPRLPTVAPGVLSGGLNLQAPTVSPAAPVVVVQAAAPAEAPAPNAPTTQPAQPQATAPVDTYTRETCNYVQTRERGTDRVVRQVPREGFRLCQVGMEARSYHVDAPAFTLLQYASSFIMGPLQDDVSVGASVNAHVGAGLLAEAYVNVSPSYNTISTTALDMSSFRLGLGLLDRRDNGNFYSTQAFALELDYTHIGNVSALTGTPTVEGADVLRLSVVDRSQMIGVRFGPIDLGLRLAVFRAPFLTILDGGRVSGTLGDTRVSDYMPQNPLNLFEFSAMYSLNRPSSYSDTRFPSVRRPLTTADRVNTWLGFVGRSFVRNYTNLTTVAPALALASERGRLIDGAQYDEIQSAVLILGVLNAVTNLMPVTADATEYAIDGEKIDRGLIIGAGSAELLILGAIGFLQLFGSEPTSHFSSAARIGFYEMAGAGISTGFNSIRQNFNASAQQELNNPKAYSLVSPIVGGLMGVGGVLTLALTRFGLPNATTIDPGLTPAQQQDVVDENQIRAERNFGAAVAGWAAVGVGLQGIIDLVRGNNDNLNNQQPLPAHPSLPSVAANHSDAVYLNGSGRLAPNGRYLTGLNASLRGLPGGALLSVGFHL